MRTKLPTSHPTNRIQNRVFNTHGLKYSNRFHYFIPTQLLLAPRSNQILSKSHWNITSTKPLLHQETQIILHKGQTGQIQYKPDYQMRTKLPISTLTLTSDKPQPTNWTSAVTAAEFYNYQRILPQETDCMVAAEPVCGATYSK